LPGSGRGGMGVDMIDSDDRHRPAAPALPGCNVGKPWSVTR